MQQLDEVRHCRRQGSRERGAAGETGTELVLRPSQGDLEEPEALVRSFVPMFSPSLQLSAPRKGELERRLGLALPCSLPLCL